MEVTPPLDEFTHLLEDAYRKISYHHTLSTQALKEMKAWIDSLLTREAQQNVSQLERENTVEAMAPNEESDITIVRKRRWVDKLMDKKGKQKYHKGDNASSSAQMDDLVKQVTGNNAPEKLIVKTKPKSVNFQGKFEKDAMDAL
ncbi:unnamed protein product [Calypogeia fissa]